MGARPPYNFWGLKTGGDAWRMNRKNYFMLVSWLRHCAATAVVLQMHEGVNAFNLVTDKTNAADLGSSGVFAMVYGVFAISINVTRLPFHRFCQKLANVTKEALKCTASL